MHNIGPAEIFGVVLVILLLLSADKLGPAIRDLFRGGPRPPSHPLLGDDSKFLNRRRSRQAPEF